MLGYEGDAASIYFGNWPLLPKESQRRLWSWGGRSDGPAKDPLNAMLNHAYSLLLADSVRAVIACGLDPPMQGSCIAAGGISPPSLST